MKNIVFIFLLFVSINLLAQDSVKKKNTFFHVTVGASEFVPFIAESKEISGSKDGDMYSNYDIYNNITFGYNLSAGLGISLNERLILVSDISYFNVQESQNKIGESYCAVCYFPIQFNGIQSIKNSYHNIGTQFSLSLS